MCQFTNFLIHGFLQISWLLMSTMQEITELLAILSFLYPESFSLHKWKFQNTTYKCLITVNDCDRNYSFIYKISPLQTTFVNYTHKSYHFPHWIRKKYLETNWYNPEKPDLTFSTIDRSISLFFRNSMFIWILIALI